MRCRYGVLVIALLGNGVFLAAQSSLAGTVRDSGGLGVPSAQLNLTDESRGNTHKTTSKDSGDYLFNGLPAGTYTLKVSRAGFETSTVGNVRVEDDRRTTLDVAMRPGASSQTVRVSAHGDTPLLDETSNALGTTIDQKNLESLPVNDRDFLTLALLAETTDLPQGVADAVMGQSQHPDRSIIISGNSQFQTSYLIDGVSTRGQRVGESSLNLSISAIDQMRVQVGFFLPDLGPNPGIVNVITKGGNNEFHGEAFEFLRNSALDARNFFSPVPEQLQRNEFGFGAGGPVTIPGVFNGADKVWFHADYEGTRQIQKFTSSAFTPTAAMFNGDLSAVPQAVYDPFSYSTATKKRQPFAGNVVPLTRINAASLGLLQYYVPGSTYTRRPSNLFGEPRYTLNDDQFTVQVNASLSGRQSLFVNVSNENSPVLQASLMPLAGGYYPFNAQLAVLQHTMTFGADLVNIARIGFSRSEVRNEGQGETGGDLLTPLGITGTLDQRGVPAISIQGFTGFGLGAGPLGDTNNSYQVDEGLTWTRGAHNFAFGAGLRYHRTLQQNANTNALGSLSFQTVYTAQLTTASNGSVSPAANTGSAFADFLLGIPTSGQVVGLPPLHYRYTEYFPYFEDRWRAASTLTINHGLSWFYSTPPNPQGADRSIPHGFNFQTGLLEYAALGQINPEVIRPDKNNFTPRLGLAWAPRFLKNTVIRAGAGFYFGQMGLIEAQFASVAPPFQSPVSISNNQFAPLPTYLMGQNVFPVIPVAPLTPSFAANLPNGFAPYIASPDSRTPYVAQWNFSVQHSIGASHLLEASYIGTSAHDQQNRYDADECIAAASLNCRPSTRPYPRYTSLLYSINNANLTYEAMILKYQHRFSQGFTVLTNYTYSKALSDGWESGSSTMNQSANCRSCDKGPVSYDIPHRIVAAMVYQLPFGRDRAYGANLPLAADLILGGWNVSGILTFAKGSAFTITAPNRTGSPYSVVRADRLCNGAASQLSGNLRSDGGLDFDTSCFASPAAGYFGSSGRGVLFGPGVDNWDTSVAKLFNLRDRAHLEFRGEFFNTWNHAQFNNPDAGSGDINFGLVSSARPPRLVQVALRLIW